MKVRFDCRYFRGDIPCAPGRICEGCVDFTPMGGKILIIKLGAIGDVLRTTPILPVLREKNDPCHITWIVDKAGEPLLKNNPHIDRLVPYGPEAIIRVQVEKFDHVICLDKHPGAAGLASMAGADEKTGFIVDPSGAISFTGDSVEYAYRLGLDDDLKFRINRKTYQEMTFDMLGLKWEKQGYILDLTDQVRDAGRAEANKISFKGKGPLIGLFTGAGDVWPMKRWVITSFAELADKLAGELDARAMLLGAERDKARNIVIADAAKSNLPLAPHDLDIMEFAGLVNACDLIVTGDTLAMHLGVALNIPTVTLFGPTSAVEVEMYDTGVAIVPEIDCAPCYRPECDVSPNCMELISVENVFDAVKEALKR